MIPPENEEWHAVWFPGFFFYFLCNVNILFRYQLNYQLDKHNYIKKRYSDGVNYDLNIVFMTTSYYLLLTILPKKSKVVESNTISQQA